MRSTDIRTLSTPKATITPQFGSFFADFKIKRLGNSVSSFGELAIIDHPTAIN